MTDVPDVMTELDRGIKRRPTQVEQAKLDAARIAKELMEKYPGEAFYKSTLRLLYGMPNNRATLVFALLRQAYNFEEQTTTFIVPGERRTENKDINREEVKQNVRKIPRLE